MSLPSASTPRCVRILVAEDNDAMRKLLRYHLELDDYEVVEAASGSELLTLLAPFIESQDTRPQSRRLPFDVILSDIRMPGLSGLKVLSLLRKCDGSTPFILMTAFGDIVTETEARELGATALLEKPFDTSTLRRLIRNVLRA